MANATAASIVARAADDSFGPFYKVTGRQDFDFTLLFEDTILSILPSAALLLVTPLRIIQLWKSSRKVAASQLRNVKIVLLAAYCILQVVNLALWCLDSRIQSRASIAAASMSLAAACAVWTLSYMEHTRNTRPSSIINAYLLVTVLLDAAKVRTMWLRGASVSVAGTGSAALAIKSVLLVIEAKEKRAILLSPYSNSSPEATSGLYSRSLFWWLNPMFLLGYRNIIREADLFVTDDDLLSANLHKKFQARWTARSVLARRHELIYAVARCLIGPLLAGVFPRLCQIFFRYMQPLLIRSVTKLVAEPESRLVNSQGWGLTAAYGLVYFGAAVSVALFKHRAFRLATMVRGVLVTAVYTKTMDLSITNLDENAAVTLMSTDVQRICDAVPLLHDIWGSVVEVAIGIWLLYSEVGIAMLGSMLIIAISITGTFAVSAKTGTAQKEWLAAIQTRVDVTSKALQSMKGVKMLGLISTLTDIIHRLRLKEILNSLNTRRLFVASLVCGNISDVYAPGATFVIFVIIAHYNGQVLDVSQAYTALSLVALVANPIRALAFSIPPLTAAVGCFDRVQDYLLSETRQDHRLLMSSPQAQHMTRAKPDVEESNSSAGDIQLRELSRPEHTKVISRKAIAVLRAVNLTLVWKDGESPVINDASFDISPGVTMLVGPVGSGKSSLFKGLLGELPSSKGYVYTDSLQIAFVGQNPWIQHGTLRENITGVSVFEHKFYSSVVHACALEQDIESLPQGDLTPVGSAGVSLSGGQKLRVALARAVYSRRHILMLDDVFSGLDATSEDRIFSRLLGRNGLLREMGAAVLLATHAAHRLSYADNIIALDSHGSVTQQGTFEELVSTTGYVASLAARHTSEKIHEPKEIAKLTKTAAVDSSAQANAADDLSRAVGDVAVYKYYLGAIGYGRSLLMLGLLSMFAFTSQFPNLWVKFWTTAIEQHGNSINGKYLAGFIAMETAAFVVLIYLSIHTFVGMIPHSARELHTRLLTTMKEAPLSFFTSTDVGQIINRFSQDMNVIDLELPMSFFEVTASVCIGLIQAVFICLSAAYFSATMPAVFGLMYLIQKFYLRTSRQIRLMDLETKAPLYSHFIESLNGLTTVRAFGWTYDFEQRNLSLLDRSQRPFYLLFCIQRWLQLVLDLTVAALAVFLMILIVTLRTKVDAGLVGLALLNIMGFNLTLTQIIKEWTTLETSLGAIARVKSFVLETKSENLPWETSLLPEGWPSKGSITFDNVSAAYTSTGAVVLKNINLVIPSRQKIGLVGRSGSGKSSFITTLFHMLEITSGTITVDNVDLATISREGLRRRLNVIPQEPVFMAGSVRANLDPLAVLTGGSDNDDGLITVLKTVGLWTVISHAGGLDVAMDAENLLSQGQRQLFCLARAIVNKAQSRILILDEATASVDLQTDETMQRIIRDEFVGFTVIAVAHRLNTVLDFDRVLVMDFGEVVEDGSPMELLEVPDSRFRKLWDS